MTTNVTPFAKGELPKIRDSLMDRLATEADKRSEKPKPKPQQKSRWAWVAFAA